MKAQRWFLRLIGYSKPRSRRQGMALILILSVCGLLVIFSGAVGLGAVNNLRVLTRQEEVDQARYAAQGGIAVALNRLSLPTQFPTVQLPPTFTQNTGSGASWSDVDYYYQPDYSKLQSTTNNKISALVQIYNNTAAAFHRSSTLPDGTVIPEGKAFVISSGVFEDGARRGSSTVGALLKPLGVSFDRCAFGKSELRMTDTLVDVVDSRWFGWSPLTYAPYSFATHPQRGASVATSNRAMGSVYLTNTQVDGNITVGPGSAPGTIAYMGGSSLTGVDSAFGHAPELQKPNPPATALPMANSGSDAVFAGGGTLPQGTYRVTGDLTFNGANMNLAGPGPTIIFVRGNVTITGSALNMGSRPANLQIFSYGPAGTTINVTDSQVSALVSGSDAIATLNNSDQFGALVADRITTTNCKLHYDRSVVFEIFGSLDWVVESFVGVATTKTVAVVPPPEGPPAGPGAVAGPPPAIPGPAPAPGPAPGPDPAPGPAPAPGPDPAPGPAPAPGPDPAPGPAPAPPPAGPGPGPAPAPPPPGPGPAPAPPPPAPGPAPAPPPPAPGPAPAPPPPAPAPPPPAPAPPPPAPAPPPPPPPAPPPAPPPPPGPPPPPPEPRMCCRDYSCGPPRCMLW